ncbi:hypothetical protein LTR09_004298 [Extremus antarcticus]|uniref:Peptidase A1 domain-containing protein n=1 Tax=Extremus antarcticus TaxID=702011 RepID=A0AAJ0G9M1_9PEZI|nr:hypothetical protein LTR09_004298 [Extremus antarcticus]
MKSSTFKWSAGQSWMITYGDSSAAGGGVGKDVVEIGGLCLRNQAIELAETISTSFQNNAADGLLGLAWGSINTVTPTRVRTPVENMVAQSAIATYAELFTAYLGSYKDASDPDRGQSFYTFGYIDKDVVKSTGSDVYYAPVDNSNGFWQFPSSSYTINGTVTKTAGRTAIADTGTSLALVDDATCKAIYDAIPGSKLSKEFGGYIYPKDTPADKLPSIGFDIGGKTFKLNKEDLGYAPIGSGMVYGGVQSAGDLPSNILGDTFLKAVYAVFDCGRQRFGCVQRGEPDKPKAAEKKDATPTLPVVKPAAPTPAAPTPAAPAPPPATPAPPKPAPPAPVVAAVVPPPTPAPPKPAAPTLAPPPPTAPPAAPVAPPSAPNANAPAPTPAPAPAGPSATPSDPPVVPRPPPPPPPADPAPAPDAA